MRKRAAQPKDIFELRVRETVIKLVEVEAPDAATARENYSAGIDILSEREIDSTDYEIESVEEIV